MWHHPNHRHCIDNVHVIIFDTLDYCFHLAWKWINGAWTPPKKKRQQLSIFQVITSCIFHKSTNIFTSLISCHFRYESCESIEFGRCVFPPHIFHSLLLLYTIFFFPLNLFNFRKFGGRFMCVCVCVFFSVSLKYVLPTQKLPSFQF